MTSKSALPPWLLAAVDNAGDATVILKPGDRAFVIRSTGPYHLGTQPLTNVMIEGLAQQILSEPGHQALSRGDTVEETVAGPIPVTVQAIRMDYDVVIRVRRAQNPLRDAVSEPAAPWSTRSRWPSRKRRASSRRASRNWPDRQLNPLHPPLPRSKDLPQRRRTPRQRSEPGRRSRRRDRFAGRGRGNGHVHC